MITPPRSRLTGKRSLPWTLETYGLPVIFRRLWSDSKGCARLGLAKFQENIQLLAKRAADGENLGQAQLPGQPQQLPGATMAGASMQGQPLQGQPMAGQPLPGQPPHGGHGHDEATGIKKIIARSTRCRRSTGTNWPTRRSVRGWRRWRLAGMPNV